MDFTRCYSCMQELDRPGGRCPRCGNDNTTLARSQPSHALPCGYLLHGRYVIGKTLGQGGFGMTYIGWDLALETRVCIKEYFPAGAAMRSSTMSTTVTWSGGNNAEELKGGRESFIKEARKAVKLRKLNAVVQVWDVFYENETAYLVMDYVEGVTLKHHLMETRKALSEEECVRLLLPVMKDLEAVHARGIIHRDISPDNLMLQTDGTLVLLDIGAAKDLSRGNGQSSMLVAKKGFSPLEQYATGGSIGPWTDVYAMCATIVYCVTGGLIPTPMDRMSGEELDLGGFSPAFTEVLNRGLAIRPKERIQTMSELANSLIVATKSIATPEPIPGTSTERVPVPTPELKPELEPTPTPKLPHGPVSKPDTKPPVPKKEPRRGIATGIGYLVKWILAVVVLVGAVILILVLAITDSSGETDNYADTQMEPIKTTEVASLTYTFYKTYAVVTDCDTSKTSAIIAGSIGGTPVTGIEENAFRDCVKLESITLPDGITYIGTHAFFRCAQLRSIVIPASVKEIGVGAFDDCTAMKNVYYQGSEEEWREIEIKSPNRDLLKAKIHCISSQTKEIPIETKEVASLTYTVYKTHIAVTCCDTSKTSAIIAGSIGGTPVTEIGDNAFRDCVKLKEITLPNSVSFIGTKAFFRCTNLSNITIPVSVEEISPGAFDGCSALRDVYFEGSEQQWKAITIGSSNKPLSQAIIHYNSGSK